MLPSAIHPSLIGHLDLIFGSGMQVFGSALAVTALAWGLGRRAALAEIFGPSRAAAPGHTGPIPSTLHALLLWWLRWAVPGALLAILFLYIRSRIE